MKGLFNIRKIYLIAIIGAVVLSSCVPQKKMLLLKEMQMATENTSIEYQNERTLDYKIQPGDNLFIRATSIIDEKNSVLLNGDARGGNYLTSDASIYLNSYTVNKDGFIDYPLTGLVEVKNLTVEEAKEKLQNVLSKYVKETSLMVKLSNFDLTIIGEVTRPGKFKIYQSEIGILEALALAGNVTNFAKTDNVKLVRRTDNGSEIITLNVGNADILSSPYYYLKPNDILYVEPMKAKQWGFTSFPYSTVLSIISLGITALAFYMNYYRP
ncbi:MAG: polysaccharide biosynthesis/export family protein [Bacteroidales bacterium]|nr:polysaccharide biosynthesis/export family protein [Bacteroidales bacterium]